MSRPLHLGPNSQRNVPTTILVLAGVTTWEAAERVPSSLADRVGRGWPGRQGWPNPATLRAPAARGCSISGCEASVNSRNSPVSANGGEALS